MRCGHDHHDTVLFQLPPEKSARTQSDRTELQQISYEVDRLDDLQQKAAELQAQGVQVVGPEQKGPGMDKTIEFTDLTVTGFNFTAIWIKSAGTTRVARPNGGGGQTFFNRRC